MINRNNHLTKTPNNKIKQLAIIVFLTSFLLGCKQENQKADEKTLIKNAIKPTEKKEQKPIEISKETKPDFFNDALQALYTEFHYKAQEVIGNTLYRTDTSDFEKLVNKFKDDTKCNALYNLPSCEANFDLVKSIKSAYIKGEKPLEGQLYLKAQIQEWQFESVAKAMEFESSLNTCQSHRECVNKGGITWWRVQNRMYIIETPAHRYSFEFDKIKEVMNRRLKQTI